jgi:hypothetical protein
MNYKIKYLKYKQKYLNFKKTIGGGVDATYNINTGGYPRHPLPNIFIIYTTGIADDGREGENSYSNIWNRFVREEILRFIPENFNHIEILHFDIFEGAVIPSFSEERKNQLERTLRENLTNSDITDRSGRIVSSEFNRLPLDIDTQYPFVIIDFAHILRIVNSRRSILRTDGSYVEPFTINGEEHEGRSFYAPFLYIGYGNRDQRYFTSAHTQRIPLLNISENGLVTTYEGYYKDRGLEVRSPNPKPDIILICKDLIKRKLNFSKSILTEPVKYNKIAKILSTTNFINNVLEQLLDETPLETILNFDEFTKELSNMCINIINENIETEDINFFNNYQLS